MRFQKEQGSGFDVEEPFWGISGQLGSFMKWKERKEPK